MRREGKDLHKVKDLTPEAVKLGFDFAVKRRDSSAALDIPEQIEKLSTLGVINKTWKKNQ